MQRRLIFLLFAALLPAAAFAQTPQPAPRPSAQPTTAPRATPAPRAASDTDAARRELRDAQRELERASSRIAELTQKLYRDDIEMALHRPAFERPVLGVVMSGDERAGVRLAAVTPESPAAKAGLRSGDRLIRIDGQALSGTDPDSRLAQARALIGELQQDQEVRLAYQRGDQTREVTVKADSMPGLVWWRGEGQTPEAIRMQLRPLLAENFKMDIGAISPLSGCGVGGNDCLLAPMAEAYRWRGLRLAALEPKLGRYFGAERGVLVLTTPGDELAGLEPGDVIVEIDGTAVEQPQDAMRLMRGKAPGSRIAVDFLRDRKSRQVQLDAPKFARFPLLLPPPPPPAPPAPPVAPTPPPALAPEAMPAVPAMPSMRSVPSPPEPPASPAPPEGDRPGVLERVLSG